MSENVHLVHEPHCLEAASVRALLPIKAYQYYAYQSLSSLRGLGGEAEGSVENGGKHPLGTSDFLYLPRRVGDRGPKSIEAEYKLTKVKAAVRL